MKSCSLVPLAALVFTIGAFSSGKCLAELNDSSPGNRGYGKPRSGAVLSERGGRHLIQAPARDTAGYFGIDTPKIEYSTSRGTPWLVVISPNGGEEWCVGSSHDIMFDCSEISSVEIEYGMVVGSGWTWLPIVASTSCGAGSYSWNIPNTVNSGWWLRICDSEYHYLCDYSNDDFSIITCFPGDANGDQVADGADLVFLINYLFKWGDPPDPMANGDVNADCVVSPPDLVYFINYLFRDGEPLLVGCT
jgi:hypothetical protein